MTGPLLPGVYTLVVMKMEAWMGIGQSWGGGSLHQSLESRMTEEH